MRSGPLIAALPFALSAQLVPAPPRERCLPAAANTASARTWLDRAAANVLPASFGGKVLHFRATLDVPFWEQSDRTYEPFIPSVTTTDRWYDLSTGVEARQPVDRSV